MMLVVIGRLCREARPTFLLKMARKRTFKVFHLVAHLHS